MSEAKVKSEPQNCPKCGSAPVVKNPKPRIWYVECSRNSETVLGHRVSGHTMHTRRDAINVWNDLT
jgi:ribosomal protein L37AE/L43A